MDHLSAQPLDCQLLDIYQQIHISHTRPHLYAHTEKDAHSVTLLVLTVVEVHPQTPTQTHTERLLTFASSTHFSARHFQMKDMR